jgi:hypothetical protein
VTVKTPEPPPLPDELDALLRRLRMPYLTDGTDSYRLAQATAGKGVRPLA